MRIILLALLCIGSASAMTDAEAKAQFTKFVTSCLGEHPVDPVDLMKLETMVLPNKREVKCLLACTYRKIGTMNKEGMFDLQKSYELAEKTKKGDEKGITNGKKLVDICIKVNDETVSDGEKGCDRAGLFFKCFVSNAPQFGFKI